MKKYIRRGYVDKKDVEQNFLYCIDDDEFVYINNADTFAGIDNGSVFEYEKDKEPKRARITIADEEDIADAGRAPESLKCLWPSEMKIQDLTFVYVKALPHKFFFEVNAEDECLVIGAIEQRFIKLTKRNWNSLGIDKLPFGSVFVVENGKAKVISTLKELQNKNLNEFEVHLICNIVQKKLNEWTNGVADFCSDCTHDCKQNIPVSGCNSYEFIEKKVKIERKTRRKRA